MQDSKTIRKHLKGGKPTKYNKEEHIDLLVNIFCEKDNSSIAKFCAEALIDKQTFYNWKKVHPEFKYAYDVVINVAEAKFEDLPFTTSPSEFNHGSWYLMMKNKFGFGKPAIDLTGEKTPQARIEIIMRTLADGGLNIDEAIKLTNMIGIQADVDQGNEAIQNMKRTREEETKLLSAYDAALKSYDNPS